MVRLQTDEIDVASMIASVEDSRLGGVVAFLGEVRSITQGQQTLRIVYEAYEPMALSEMQKIAEEATARWDAKVAMVHRLGELLPGEIAVVTVAACAHRNEAFECCRFLIDRIKDDVPIWKHEYGTDGAVWVEGGSFVKDSS